MKNAIAPLALLTALSLALAACSSGSDAGLPGDADDTQPFSGIGADETINMVGTEPFWNVEVVGNSITYSTPEQIDGITGVVERFAGRGGYSLSGTLEGRILDATITPAECSDGMSDREFPFAVTLMLGSDVLEGCGWTEATPFTEAQY